MRPYFGDFVLARQDAHRNGDLFRILSIQQRRVTLCCSLKYGAFLADQRRNLAAPAEPKNCPRLYLWVHLLDVYHDGGNQGDCLRWIPVPVHEIRDSLELFRRLWRKVLKVLRMVSKEVGHKNLKFASIVRLLVVVVCQDIGTL